MIDKRNRLYTRRSTAISVPVQQLPAHRRPLLTSTTAQERPSSLTVRAATVGDAGQLIAIWNDAFVFSGTGGRSQVYGADDYLEVLDGGELAVAERDGNCLGIVAMVSPRGPLPTIARPDELQLAMLAVAQSAR